MRTVQAQIEQYVANGAPVPPEAAVAARNISEPGLLADMVAYSPDMSTEQRQEMLETIDVTERLKLVSNFLANQIEILELKGRIQSEVKSEMDKTQREYILREQLKAIQRELGEDDPQQAEINELRDKVEAAGMPEEIKARAIKEVDRMSRIPSASPEVGVIRTYVDWLIGLPWNVATDDQLDIKEAARILDEDHYGLEKIKERILEYLAVRTLADEIRSPILAFVGPPGVGKTVARQEHRPGDGPQVRPDEPRRHPRRGRDPRPPAHLHRRAARPDHPEHQDRGLEQPGVHARRGRQDRDGLPGRPELGPARGPRPGAEQHASRTTTSRCRSTSARCSSSPPRNLLDPIPPALRDRMEIVQLPGYTEQEKIEIGKRFLIPKQMTNHGLKAKHIEITDEAMTELVRSYTHEAGVRNLEREIANVMRKVARQVAEGRKRKTVIDPKKLADLLGPQRFEYGELEAEDQTGSGDRPGRDRGRRRRRRHRGHPDGRPRGLHPDRPAGRGHARVGASRPVVDPGPRRASSASSARSFEKNTLHIHVPAGGIPKDGPSAGITMATAIVSALTGIPVRKDVAMTGEITLRGRVLPIGGLKSKILAAHLAGRQDRHPAAQEREGPARHPRGDPQVDQARPGRQHGAGPRGGPPAQAEGARRRAAQDRQGRRPARSRAGKSRRVRRDDFPPTDQPPVVVGGH